MVIRNAIKKCSGFSLVEFMVAALMGGMALTIVGGVFISTQKSAAERSKQIMLLQNMTSAMQQLKEDVLRAGFDSNSATSVRFLGENNIVYEQRRPDALGYVYRVVSDASEEYRHVVYWLKTSKLLLCEKSHTSLMTVYNTANSRVKGNCYSVFDPKQITVTEFLITHRQLENNVKSAFITVRLSASLTNDPSVNESLEISFKQRNW